MITSYSPITVLPIDFQSNWGASVNPASPTVDGVIHLVAIERTDPKTFEEGRIIVRVIDENHFPVANIKIAFAYSTANQYLLTDNFSWLPPQPHRAFVIPTGADGQIDQIQGSPVKYGQSGGVTVYCLEPNLSCDYVTGMGMLADHTGVKLTFKLYRNGVVSFDDRIAALEARVAALEGK